MFFPRRVVDIICFTLMFGISTLSQFAYAENAELWIPNEMILGVMYEGLLVLEKPTGGVFALALEDSSMAKTDSYLTILPGSNHGIFEIMPKKNGEVVVYTEINGKLINASSRVYSLSGKTHGLEIIFPSNSTKSEITTGFVITTNVNEAPMSVDSDTEISLTSSGSVIVPKTITVKAGKHYAKFDAYVHGTGIVYASTPSLEHTEYQIKKHDNQIVVRLAAAPAIALQNSQVLITAWLEKDGKPFNPPYVLDAYISSSNTDIARIEKFSGLAHDDIAIIPMIDGVGSKQITTYDEGTVVITANVKGFGSAQTLLIVGPTKSNLMSEFLINVASGSMSNVAVVWAQPRLSTDEFIGVVSLYEIEHSSVAPSQNFTVTSLEDGLGGNIIEKITPIKLNEQVVVLSSTSLTHPDSLLMHGSVMKGRFLHAVKFDIATKNFGNHRIFVSGPDLEQTRTEIVSSPSYEETYKLKITPVPAFAGIQQALALVCITDSNGSTLSADKMLGPNTHITISVDTTVQKLSFYEESCVTLYGKIDDVVLVTASAQGIEPTYKKIHPAQKAASIKIDVPKWIHAGEEAPFILHKIDPFGIPIARAEFSSITNNVEIRDQRLLAYGSDSMDVVGLTGFGPIEFDLELFVNQMRFEALAESTVTKVGRDLAVSIDSDVVDLDVSVDSPVPVKEAPGNVFLLAPTDEGIFSVVFSAKKEGYATAMSEVVFTAKKTTEVDIQAFGSDGRELSVNIHPLNNSIYQGLRTPEVLEVKSGLIGLKFPTMHSIEGRNYVLSKIVVNNRTVSDAEGVLNFYVNSDTNLVIHYERSVMVNVAGAHGSGAYSYGSEVLLSAPPRDVYWFLVKEVYDGWDGFDAGNLQTVSFIATSDVNGRVMYKNDYGGLMVVSVVIVTGIVSYILLKGRLFGKKRNAELVNTGNDW